MNLPENIPKFKQWISDKSWSQWQQFLENDLDTMTTVSQCNTNSGWYLDVLKAASIRRAHTRGEEVHSESDGMVLEEMLFEEQLTTTVCVLCIWIATVHVVKFVANLAYGENQK